MKSNKAKMMTCPQCGARASSKAYKCKSCGATLATTSDAPGNVSVSFTASLVQGLRDHFNPALHAVEEVVNTATKRSKQK